MSVDLFEMKAQRRQTTKREKQNKIYETLFWIEVNKI